MSSIASDGRKPNCKNVPIKYWSDFVPTLLLVPTPNQTWACSAGLETDLSFPYAHFPMSSPVLLWPVTSTHKGAITAL